MHEQPNLSRSSKAKKVKKVQKFRKVKEVKKVRKVKKLRKVKKFRKAKKVEKAKKVKKANCKTWLGLLVPIPNAGEKGDWKWWKKFVTLYKIFALQSKAHHLELLE